MRSLPTHFRNKLVTVILVCLLSSIAKGKPKQDPPPNTLSTPVPVIPEPLVFDLMRPLHARTGELEINALASFKHRGKTHWAPEVEYALADGVAIEFELPFSGAHWDATKFGAQFRLAHNENTAHGVQLLAERSADDRDTQFNALYLLGHRFDSRWSLMSMSGVRYSFPRAKDGGWEGLQNLSLFHNTTENFVLGIEIDTVFSNEQGLRELLVMPQAHIELNSTCSLQLGVGTLKNSNTPWQTVFSARTILAW